MSAAFRITRIGDPGVNYDANIEDAGGDGCDQVIIPAREFLTSGNLASLAKSKPTPSVADGDHCRETAGKLRELALYTRSLAPAASWLISRNGTTGGAIILASGYAG
jgi:hypothetical protein